MTMVEACVNVHFLADGNSQQIGERIPKRRTPAKGVTNTPSMYRTMALGGWWLRLRYSPSCSVP